MTSFQGTLIALASFSQEKLLNMLRSAALLSPIAYLNHLPSPLARGIIDLFLAELKPDEWISLIQKIDFPNLNLKEKNSLTFLLSILSLYCTALLFIAQDLYWLGVYEFAPRGG